MAGERLPTLSSMERNSRGESPRPRPISVIHRDIEQAIAELEMSNEEHGLEMAEIHRAIDRLDAEIALLSRDEDDLYYPDDSSLLDLITPSLPTGESSEENVSTQAGTKFVDQLPGMNLKDLPKDSSCNICMDPFSSTEDPELPVRLPCGHVIGRNCISKWLATSNSCPLCRRVFFEPEVRNPPLTETELRAMLQTTRPATETDLDERVVLASLSMQDVESFGRELNDITRQQIAMERRLASFEAQSTPLTPGSEMQLRELMADNVELHARLGDFSIRHRELIESHGIQLPRVGRFFSGL